MKIFHRVLKLFSTQENVYGQIDGGTDARLIAIYPNLSTRG